MASSTITGVGSGFDTIGIVKALVDVLKSTQAKPDYRATKRHHHSVVRCGHGKRLA